MDFARCFRNSFHVAAAGRAVRGLTCHQHADTIAPPRQRCRSQPHFSSPFSQQLTHGPRMRPKRARTRPRSPCCLRRSRPGRARLCASSLLSEKPLAGELSLIAPDGSVAAKSTQRGTADHLISGSPRSRRRRREAGARRSRAAARRPAAARSRAQSPCAASNRRRRARRREASGPCAISGTARRKTCIPRGSRSCSTGRSMSNCHGRRCMTCCAIDRAISCSTIWVSAKTRRVSSFAPTAPTSRIFCAPISRSRWGFRSAIRAARAASAASRRSATLWSTF